MNADPAILARIDERLSRIEVRFGIDADYRRLQADPPIAAIVDDAAHRLGLGVREIVAPYRDASCAHARFAVAWAARRAIEACSLPRIGRALGGRDHTTILHALRRADALREADPDFRRLTDRLLAAAKARAGQ